MGDLPANVDPTVSLLEDAGYIPARGLATAVFLALHDPRYLLERPLLQALRPPARTETGPPVLLIDDLDRADPAFEALLLELLGEFQLTVPELGTIRAPSPPVVVLTSNRTRDIHDALRRRCLYHWVAYPDVVTERRILAPRLPGLREALRSQLVAAVRRLRERPELYKAPGVAETVDWARALEKLGATQLTAELIEGTLGTLLKYEEDIGRLRGAEVAQLLEEVRADMEVPDGADRHGEQAID